MKKNQPNNKTPAKAPAAKGTVTPAKAAQDSATMQNTVKSQKSVLEEEEDAILEEVSPSKTGECISSYLGDN